MNDLLIRIKEIYPLIAHTRITSKMEILFIDLGCTNVHHTAEAANYFLEKKIKELEGANE